jgi:hypothetical protein
MKKKNAEHGKGNKMSRYHELLNLKHGEKYTLLWMSSFGMGLSEMKGTLEQIELCSYAQYGEAVKITLKPFRKKKSVTMVFYPGKDFMMYHGYVEADTEMVRSWKSSGDVVVGETLLAFDPEYFEIAKRSVKEKPVFECFEK